MLPEEGDLFTEVIFTELDRKESQALIETYNKEGRAAGYGGQQKRPRLDSRGDNRDRNSSRGGGGGGYRPRGEVTQTCDARCLYRYQG